jgi:hypothetical protein
MSTSRICRYASGVWAAAAFLAGCGGSQPSLAGSSVAAQSRDSVGNIYWNKKRLRLQYPSKSRADAVLSYWGPDGYSTYPIICKAGGQISVTPHRTRGNPSGYEHVTYSFQARSAGPDDCSFTAVLNNTGSPPFAILRLHIDGS